LPRSAGNGAQRSAILYPCDAVLDAAADLDRDYRRTEGLYYNYGEDFGYRAMFRDGMQDAIASLEEYVRGQPPAFWAALQPEAE
jgi:hypothetical protein